MFVCLCVYMYIHLSYQSAGEEASWGLMNGLDKRGITELRSLKQPPDAIKDVVAGVLVLMAEENIPDPRDTSWKEHSFTVLYIVALSLTCIVPSTVALTTCFSTVLYMVALRTST